MPRKRPRRNPVEYEFEPGEGFERTSIRLPTGVLGALDEALDWFECSSRNQLISEILIEWLEQEYPFDQEAE